MFSTLFESKGRRAKRTAGSVVSLLVHAGVVGALVTATANATARVRNDPEETRIHFTPPPPTLPATPAPPTSSAVGVYGDTPPALGAPALGAPALDVPLDIPTGIPPVDLTRGVTDADDFATGRRGVGHGVPGSGAPLSPSDYHVAGQVEKPVLALPGTVGPAYPDLLRTSGIEGQVLAEFVVDTTGAARMDTFRVLRSDHVLFTNAVKQSLGRIRFLPAEVDGRRVPQLVQQTFQFALTR